MKKLGRPRTVTRSSEFSTLASNALAKVGSTQTAMADSMRYSTSYLNQVVTGRKKPNAEWADLIADIAKVSDEERVRLHRAAAAENGYQLDLTKK